MSLATPITAEEPAGRPRPDPPAGRCPAPVSGTTATARILREGAFDGRVTHVERIPGRAGRAVPWPGWVPAELRQGFADSGISAPWAHQAAAADHARAGRNVIISTPAASGKSLGYLMPALTAVLEGGTALYLTPTKALAADQLRAIRSLRLHGVRAAVLDGDTPAAGRSWARAHASYLATTPDTLHLALLPGHARWARFLSRLRYVIVDECHGYRGVFGSHVAQVLRRLRRIAAYYAEGRAVRERARRGSRDGPMAAGPAFILASATVAEPARCAALLTGLDAEEVDADASPRGPVTFALWEPPLTALRGAAGAPLRRTATAEASRLLSDLVTENMTTVAFVRSRRAAEAVAMGARRALSETGAPDLAARVAAYRSGYLPEDRRMLEDDLRSGRLAGVAATAALELGVNSSGQGARAGPAGTHSPCSSPGPTRWTPTWCIIRRPCSAARWRAPCSTPATRTCSRRTCAPRPASCRSPRPTLTCSAPAPPRSPGSLPSAGCCAAAAGRRCRSSRPRPDGWSARWTSRRPTSSRTPAPSTSTRRRPTWCAGSTWRTTSRWWTRPSRVIRPLRES